MHSTTITTAVVLAATIFAVCAAEEHHKRAPSGFTGVRGKKSIPDSEYSAVASSDSDLKAADVVSDVGAVSKRAPSGFMGMRGKKPYPAWEGTYPDEIYKRAPSGFMGMRGKKEMEFTNFGEDYMKRAPSGFMGMRGKKEDDSYPSPFDVYFDKRAPMGFVGMRGKKYFDGLGEEDKRAPSGFFGMRGKKMPRQSGFFGMRGKKYPYEFRGKFVGVRGKKSSNEIDRSDLYNNVDLSSFGDDLDINQLMLLLTENEGNSAIWNGENGAGDYSQK